jgi:hypothetical protein
MGNNDTTTQIRNAECDHCGSAIQLGGQVLTCDTHDETACDFCWAYHDGSCDGAHALEIAGTVTVQVCTVELLGTFVAEVMASSAEGDVASVASVPLTGADDLEQVRAELAAAGWELGRLATGHEAGNIYRVERAA